MMMITLKNNLLMILIRMNKNKFNLEKLFNKKRLVQIIQILKNQYNILATNKLKILQQIV